LSDWRFPIADCRLPIADCRLPIGLSIDDLRSTIGNRRARQNSIKIPADGTIGTISSNSLVTA
jgi:hypothetical protein